jgi:hypothetical protein
MPSSGKIGSPEYRVSQTKGAFLFSFCCRKNGYRAEYYLTEAGDIEIWRYQVDADSRFWKRECESKIVPRDFRKLEIPATAVADTFAAWKECMPCRKSNYIARGYIVSALLKALTQQAA